MKNIIITNIKKSMTKESTYYVNVKASRHLVKGPEQEVLRKWALVDAVVKLLKK